MPLTTEIPTKNLGLFLELLHFFFYSDSPKSLEYIHVTPCLCVHPHHMSLSGKVFCRKVSSNVEPYAEW